MADRNQKVNINRANARELQRIDGVDSERARLILEYREMHGPFSNWEQVARVPGVGDFLTERIRGMATFGDDEQVASPNGSPWSESIDDLDDLEVVDEEAEVLGALARLDLEAAEAYDIVSQAIDEAEFIRVLQEFRRDHLQHFQALNEVLSDRGFEPLEATVDLDSSVLLSLADTMAAMGTRAAILALVSTERLTNSIYESAMTLGFEDDAVGVVERCFDDEKRHLQTLMRMHQRIVEGDRTKAEPPQPQA